MRTENRVVWSVGQWSSLMIGDPDQEKTDGKALPALLAQGWVVKSIYPMPVKKGPDAEAPGTYFVLEKGGF